MNALPIHQATATRRRKEKKIFFKWSDYKEDSDAIACESSGLDVMCIHTGEKIQGKIWSGIGIALLLKSKFFSTYLSERKMVLAKREGQLVKKPERRQVSTQFFVFSSPQNITKTAVQTRFILKEGS